MKTAIYVPDAKAAKFERAARLAGMNRSEFYCAAAERFADQLEETSLTARMDAFLDAHAQDGGAWAASAGRRLGEFAEW